MVCVCGSLSCQENCELCVSSPQELILSLAQLSPTSPEYREKLKELSTAGDKYEAYLLKKEEVNKAFQVRNEELEQYGKLMKQKKKAELEKMLVDLHMAEYDKKIAEIARGKQKIPVKTKKPPASKEEKPKTVKKLWVPDNWNVYNPEKCGAREYMGAKTQFQCNNPMCEGEGLCEYHLANYNAESKKGNPRRLKNGWWAVVGEDSNDSTRSPGHASWSAKQWWSKMDEADLRPENIQKKYPFYLCPPCSSSESESESESEQE